MDSLICDCIFRNLSKEGNGGAIDISFSITVEIFSCIFDTLQVNASGGSIFLSSSGALIHNCVFFKTCSIDYRNDASYGNALFIKKGETCFKQNSIYRCGYLEKVCTDSSFKILSQSELNSYNASSNTGSEGGSGFSVEFSDCSISYINVVDSLDCYAVENFDRTNTYEYINFINSTKVRKGIIFLSGDNVLTLKNCVFIDCFEKLLSPSTKAYFQKCYADYEFSQTGLTFEQSPATIKIIVRLHFNKKKNTVCGSFKFQTHLTFFLFIVLGK